VPFQQVVAGTVIRTMRRESFSFSFAENVGKFVILGRNVGQIRTFCKLA